MEGYDNWYLKARRRMHSDDLGEVIDGLWVFEPKMGRFRSTSPLDEEEASIIPDIQALLDDHRICCLTPVVTGMQVRRYGEVRWYAATVLAELYSRNHSTEPLILRNVAQPFEGVQAVQIAEQNGIDVSKTDRNLGLYEMLRQKDLLPTIPEINLGGDGLLGLLFITGWIDHFEGKA